MGPNESNPEASEVPEAPEVSEAAGPKVRIRLAGIAVLLLLANSMAAGVWYRETAGAGSSEDRCGSSGPSIGPECQAAGGRPLPALVAPPPSVGWFPLPTPAGTGPEGSAPEVPPAPLPTGGPLPLPALPTPLPTPLVARDDVASQTRLANQPVAVSRPQKPKPARPLPSIRYVSRYVSDLNFTSVENGWGPVERDESNGGKSSGDGDTISIRGDYYAKGLGVHSDSDVQIALDGRCTRFTSIIGLDDEARTDPDGDGADVMFKLVADGSVIYRSPELRHDSAPVAVNVDISGVRRLDLVVDDLDYRYGDHSDWANARVTCQAS